MSCSIRTIRTLESGYVSPTAIAVGPDHSLFVAEAREGRVYRDPAEGPRRAIASGLRLPIGLDALGDRFVYVTEFEGRTVQRIDQRTGRAETIVRN